MSTTEIMKGLVAAAAMMAEGNSSGKSDKLFSSDQAVVVNNILSSRKTMDGKKASDSLSDNDDDVERGDIRKPVFSPTSDKTKTEKHVDGRAARERRLEQNRRAAVESRRRKKVMIDELQRSVTFYKKSNESLKMVNLDLEQRLLLARQKVLSKQRILQALDVSIILHDAAEQLKSSEPNQDDKQPSVPSVTTVPFLPLPLNLSVCPSKINPIGLPGAISNSMYSANTYSYPSDPSLDAKVSVSDAIASQMPSGVEVGGEKYLESLRMVRLTYSRLVCRQNPRRTEKYLSLILVRNRTDG
jgi:hypothetical protein